MGSDRIEITVDTGDSGFAVGSAKWHREQERLRAELRRELGPGVLAEAPPEPGDKGAILVPIVVALASGRAIPALEKFFAAWFKSKPRTWSVNVEWGDGHIQVTGDNVSEGMLKSVADIIASKGLSDGKSG
jgi:Effector Associated Constant Component 1